MLWALGFAARETSAVHPLIVSDLSGRTGAARLIANCRSRTNGRNGWKAAVSIDYISAMSLKELIAGLLGRGNPMAASEALIHHVEGTGTGFAIDDLMTWSPTPEQEEKAIKPLLDIHERYRSREYPIGISNPASFGEIRALAEHLQSQGL